MSRAEIEKTIQPIIRDCLWQFGDFKRDDPSEAAFDRGTQGIFRPDVRRVSLLISMALSVLGNSASGQGLEIGSGYGYLLLPMARFLPNVRWTAVEHPGRTYVNQEEYGRTLGEHNCQIVTANITHERLPFSDSQFSLVTFSEVMEHLPPERLYFVLSEIGRVIRPGGILLASSPNQASLENRLKLLMGKSILDLPDEPECAPGVFQHIRLYTPSEMQSTMAKFGFTLERCVIESNNSGFRGSSPKSWKRRIRRMYERAEGRLRFLRGMGDTWHMAFRRVTRE
jgi:2-polyprenyl-3-methyl-5-hydroxy-6-metoxy-1,4-benzoquinol methylase